MLIASHRIGGLGTIPRTRIRSHAHSKSCTDGHSIAINIMDFKSTIELHRIATRGITIRLSFSHLTHNHPPPFYNPSNYSIKAPMPTARAPTTTPALTLALSAAPEAFEDVAAVPLPDVGVPAFASATPPTPVEFLHTPASNRVAVLEKVMSAHCSILLASQFKTSF